MTARYFGLVPAAGSGSRFGVEGLKQYSPLAGRPMLHHALERLLAAPEVEIAFVVLAPGDADFRKHDWSAFGERLAPLYCGGATPARERAERDRRLREPRRHQRLDAGARRGAAVPGKARSCAA